MIHVDVPAPLARWAIERAHAYRERIARPVLVEPSVAVYAWPDPDLDGGSDELVLKVTGLASVLRVSRPRKKPDASSLGGLFADEEPDAVVETIDMGPDWVLLWQREIPPELSTTLLAHYARLTWEAR